MQQARPAIVQPGSGLKGFPFDFYQTGNAKAETECLRLIAVCRERINQVVANPFSTVESLNNVLASWDKQYQASTLSVCPNKWVLRSNFINEHFAPLVRKVQERRTFHPVPDLFGAGAAARKKEAAKKEWHEALAAEQRQHSAMVAAIHAATVDIAAQRAQKSEAAAKQGRKAGVASQSEVNQWWLEAKAAAEAAADVAGMSEEYSELQSSLVNFKVPGNLPKVNILLYGGRGARILSLIGSVDTLLTRTPERGQGNRIHNIQHNMAKFNFELDPPQGSRVEAPFTLWEAWTEEREYEGEELGYILDGHIPNDFDLETDDPINPQMRARGFLPNPTLADKVHCVCFVVPRSAVTYKEYTTPLKEMKKVAMARGIPTQVFLTGMDEFVPNNHSMSSAMSTSCNQAIMMEVAKVIGNMSVKDVCPMKGSFPTQYEPATEASILIMRGLQNALYAAQDNLETMSSGGAGKPATYPAAGPTPQGPVSTSPNQEQPAEQPTKENNAVWDCLGLIADCLERNAEVLSDPYTANPQLQALHASAAAVTKAVMAAKRARDFKAAAKQAVEADAAAGRARQAEADRQPPKNKTAADTAVAARGGHALKAEAAAAGRAGEAEADWQPPEAGTEDPKRLPRELVVGRAKSLAVEYLEIADVEELVIGIQELQQQKADCVATEEIVEGLFSGTIWEAKYFDRNRLLDLLITISTPPHSLVKGDVMEQGLKNVLNTLDKTFRHAPITATLVGQAIGALAAKGVVSLKSLAEYVLVAESPDAEPKEEGKDTGLVDSGGAMKVIGSACVCLRQELGLVQAVMAWRDTGLKLSSFLRSYDREDPEAESKVVQKYDLTIPHSLADTLKQAEADRQQPVAYGAFTRRTAEAQRTQEIYEAASKAALKITEEQGHCGVLSAVRNSHDAATAKEAARMAQEAEAAAQAAREAELASKEREAEAQRRIQELELQAEQHRQAAEHEKRERAALERRVNAMSGFSELLVGGELHEGQSKTFPDGRSKFTFQDNGDLVVYRDGAAIWATNTNTASPKPAKLVVQDDGNLVLYAADGCFAGWASNTDKKEYSQTRLVLQNGGVLVLRHSSGHALWTSEGGSEEFLPSTGFGWRL